MKNQNKIYRLSLVDNETHNNIKTIRFSKLRFIIAAVTVVVMSVLLLYCLIAFTPLRNTIPGYPDVQVKKVALANAIKIDSLESVITKWNLYAENLSRVLAGEATVNFDSIVRRSALQYLSSKSEEELLRQDSLLRESVQSAERFGVSAKAIQALPIEGKHFFNPVKGVVSKEFDRVEHPGIDISTSASSIVSSILEGTVVHSAWNEDQMYVIIIQHKENLLSSYSFCSKALVRTGDEVNAGTPVAMCGSEVHDSKNGVLHLEMWLDGVPIDPAKYLSL
ncbi:MAG: M23 family metallopeptidase [Candidatus Cryptobacteroides sp.]|nr:M23 family metallopeptidase [Bacteroidales bacterium]MDY6157978.1 M23 family metallopeptidase [Candidatus Cryptobacteroides sp.]